MFGGRLPPQGGWLAPIPRPARARAGGGRGRGAGRAYSLAQRMAGRQLVPAGRGFFFAPVENLLAYMRTRPLETKRCAIAASDSFDRDSARPLLASVFPVAALVASSENTSSHARNCRTTSTRITDSTTFKINGRVGNFIVNLRDSCVTRRWTRKVQEISVPSNLIRSNG